VGRGRRVEADARATDGPPRGAPPIPAVDPALLDPTLARAEPLEVRLWLPSTRSGPLPSVPTEHRHGGRPPKPRLRRWRVPGRALRPPRPSTGCWRRERPTSGPPAAPGDDLRAFRAAARLVLAALARQRFVPGLAAGPAGAGATARWRLHLLDGDLAPTVAALASALPPACRAAADDPQAAPSARALLEDFLHACADALVRIWAGAGRRGAPKDATPAERWLAALSGTTPPSAAAPRSCSGCSRRTGTGGAASRPPATSAPASSCASRTRPTRTGPGCCARSSSRAPTPACRSTPPRPTEAPWGRWPQRFPDAQALLLTGLGHASRVFPPLRGALAGAAPAPVALAPEQAFGFLRDAAPLLEEGGFGVLVPPWWSQPEARLGARLRVAPAPGGGRGEGRVGLDQLLRYRWEVALGGATLSAEEFAELTRRKASLIRWRGAWVRLDPEAVEAAARFFERRRHQRDLSVAEALSGAFGDRAEVAGLPVVDVRFDGEAGAGWRPSRAARSASRGPTRRACARPCAPTSSTAPPG
jgi:hypothetical protein